MTSQYSAQYYSLPASQPLTVPQKAGYQSYPPYQSYAFAPHTQFPGSPPESSQSVTTGSGLTSYDPTASSTSYAGSASEYDSSNGAASVDLLDYMNERVSNAYNPIPLDRSLAQQAQTSGQLNAKTRRLQELQALARSRLAAVQADFQRGIQDAREVQRDLQWTQERVHALNQRAARKYPQQYAAAQSRYPAPIEY